jgi:hypothetical protein
MIKSFRQFLTESSDSLETKVVDEFGKPLLMYHGGSYTSGEFRGAVWFTSCEADAQYYAEQNDGRVTKAYLEIKDPLYTGSIEHLKIRPTEELLISAERRRYTIKTNEEGFIKFIEANAGVLIARDLDLDGVIDLHDGKILDAVIFSNNQIILVK